MRLIKNLSKTFHKKNSLKPHTIYLLCGYTGCGKSTVASKLQEDGYTLLSFSKEGRILANIDENSVKFSQIIDTIYNRIVGAASNNAVVVDGMATFEIIKRLNKNGYKVIVVYIELEDSIRFQRIAQRESCAIEDAIRHDEIKAVGKLKAGLNDIISNADYVINGNTSMENVYLNIKGIIQRKEGN